MYGALDRRSTMSVHIGTASSPSFWHGKVGRRAEVEMIEEEVRQAAREDDHLDIWIVVELAEDFVQTRDGLADDQVHGRIRERDPGDLWCRTFEGDRALAGHGALRSVLVAVSATGRGTRLR